MERDTLLAPWVYGEESKTVNLLAKGRGAKRGIRRRESMVVTIVEVYVKPEHIQDFIGATIENHKGSIQEPGNMRFDVLQSRQEPSLFLLYEAYDSDESSAPHKNTPHYAKWKDTVAPWMAVPRKGTTYRVICPQR